MRLKSLKISVIERYSKGVYIMDIDFMRAYYRNNYQHAYDVAVAGSEEYRKKKEIRYHKDDELSKLLGGTKTEAYKKFDEYIEAYADEMDVMLEEVYLLGAGDREKMLK